METAGSYGERLRRGMYAKLELGRERLERYQVRMQYLSPEARLREKRQFLADMEETLQDAMEQKLMQARYSLKLYLERFSGLSPLKKLNQGFSYVADEKGKTVTSISQVKAGDALRISVTDGTIETRVSSIRREER